MSAPCRPQVPTEELGHGQLQLAIDAGRPLGRLALQDLQIALHSGPVFLLIRVAEVMD